MFVYNPDLVGRLADPNKPLWPQVLANSDNGRWLGYGLNRGESLDSVLITIQDASDNTVYGFDAPSQQARLYGAARALDWMEATGRRFTYTIHQRGGAS